jgi:hypothetical protein
VTQYVNTFNCYAGIEFTVEPGDVNTPLNLLRNVTFRCSLSDTSLRPHWIVTFPDIDRNLSTMNIDDMRILIGRGVDYSSSRINIPGVLENNSTLIRCATSSNGITEFSDPVQLTIDGELHAVLKIITGWLVHFNFLTKNNSLSCTM